MRGLIILTICSMGLSACVDTSDSTERLDPPGRELEVAAPAGTVVLEGGGRPGPGRRPPFWTRASMNWRSGPIIVPPPNVASMPKF